MNKYKLDYNGKDTPDNLPDYSKKPVDYDSTNNEPIGAALKVELGPNHTNIFYKDIFSINGIKLSVLVRTKKTKSSMFVDKNKYQIEVGGIYYCNDETRIISCSSQDDCHQLISLHKLNHIIGDTHKTNIKIRKLSDTDTLKYKTFQTHLSSYINEIKVAKWDEFIITYRKFIKLGGKKMKKTRMNKKYKNNNSRRYLR